ESRCVQPSSTTGPHGQARFIADVAGARAPRGREGHAKVPHARIARQERFIDPSLRWRRLQRQCLPQGAIDKPITGDFSMKHFRQLTLAVVATLAIAPAFAQEITGPDTSGKRFAVVGGYTLAEPTKNPIIAGERTNVDGDGAATLSANYYVTD